MPRGSSQNEAAIAPSASVSTGRRTTPSIIIAFMPSSCTANSSSAMASSGVCMGMVATVMIRSS